MASRTNTKPKPRKRGERLEARITRDQKELLEFAASLDGRSLTEFVVSSAQEAAVRKIEQMKVIRLTIEESKAFAKAMLEPFEPPQRLRDGIRRYRQRVGR